MSEEAHSMSGPWQRTREVVRLAGTFSDDGLLDSTRLGGDEWGCGGKSRQRRIQILRLNTGYMDRVMSPLHHSEAL